jgi:hypothetical protein
LEGSAVKPRYKCMQYFYDGWCITDTGVENFAHDGLYPYYLQRVQHLLPCDHANRVQFCEWLQPWLHIVHDILFTDEAEFT